MAFQILVLEDDIDLRCILADVLEEQGYSVTCASSGEEAVVKATERAFDLIIADIRMEGMGGLKAIAQTRDRQSHMGSLVISGWASEAETLEAFRLSVGGYLKKPFSMATLLEQVKEILAARQAQLEQEKEQESLRELALWSLYTLTDVADQSGLVAPTGTLLRIENVAAGLSKLLGLDSSITSQLRVGASLVTLLDRAQLAFPEVAPRALAPLTTLLKGIAETPSDAPFPSLYAQLGALAAAAGTEDSETELPTRECIQSRHPGRFAETLLAHYTPLRENFVNEPRSPIAEQTPLHSLAMQRGLLCVAKTMETREELSSAAIAYKRVLENEVSVQASTAARIGLSRLSMKQGKLGSAAEWALEATIKAKPYGPMAHGVANLESGLILAQLGHESAKHTLTVAADSLENLGLKGACSVARFVLGTERNLAEILSTLADPAHWGEVSKSAAQILPLVLERWSNDEPWTQIERIIFAFPGSLLESRAMLSTRAKHNLLCILEKSPTEISRELLGGLLDSFDDPSFRARASALRDRLSGKEAVPFLRIHSLGFFELHLGESLVEERLWRTQKTKYLVAYLLARQGRAVLAEEIVDTFWPDSRAKAEQNLWAATSAARRVLKPGNFLVRDGDTLSFDWSKDYWHDFEELDTALRCASELDASAAPEQHAALTQKISRLYTGPYLQGCYFEWAVRLRGQLEMRVAETLVKGSHSFLKQQRYCEALEMAQHAYRVDPYRHEAFVMRMQAHLGLGQAEKALLCFEQGADMLRREFDLPPPESMLQVLNQIKSGRA